MRAELESVTAAAATFFVDAYERACLPSIASVADQARVIEQLSVPEGPQLLAWLGAREQHVAARALAWSSHHAVFHPAWGRMPIGAKRFLLAICGVEMDTQPDRIEEAIGVVRARLGPRPGGGPLRCASELSYQGEPPAGGIQWPRGTPPQPAAIRIENALRLEGYLRAGRWFVRLCQRQEIHVPADRQMQLAFVARVAPPGAIDTAKLPDEALLFITATLAWAVRNLTYPQAWAARLPEEKDLLFMCGGETLPLSGATSAMLESFRLRIFILDTCRARFPATREVAEDALEIQLPGATLAATGGQAPYYPISQLHTTPAALAQPGEEPAIPPAMFSSLCRRSDPCREELANGARPSHRFGVLSLHNLSWGRNPTDVPALSPDEFFSAVVWGEHIATSPDPDPWPDPSFGEVLWLATVFGCEGLTAGEDDPTTVWNTLQAWLREKDPDLPFGVEVHTRGVTPRPWSGLSSRSWALQWAPLLANSSSIPSSRQGSGGQSSNTKPPLS